MASIFGGQPPAPNVPDDPARLTQIRERRAAINPIGNWIVYEAPGSHKGEYLEITDGMTPIAQVFNRDDCSFLQHAPTDIDTLLATVEDLRAQLAAAQELSMDARRLIAIYANEEHTDPRDAEIERLRGDVDHWRGEAMRWTALHGTDKQEDKHHE